MPLLFAYGVRRFSMTWPNFDFLEIDLCRKQCLEKGEKVAIAIKMALKCTFLLQFITRFRD